MRPRPSSHNSSCNFLDPWTDAPQRRGGYLSSDSTLASHKFSFGGPRVRPRVCQSFARALQATRCDAPRATLDASDRDAFAPLSRSLFILHAVQSTCVHSACIQSTCSIFLRHTPAGSYSLLPRAADCQTPFRCESWHARKKKQRWASGRAMSMRARLTPCNHVTHPL